MGITAGGGTVVVDFKAGSVHGLPMLGAYLLRFFVNYSMPPWNKTYRFSNMRARISLANGLQILGFAYPEVPMVLTSHSHHQDATVSFDIALTANQLEALERIRLGKELTFVLDIQGEVTYNSERDSRNDRIQVLVNQKTWIDALKEMNFSSSILVELPLNSQEVAASAAWKAVQKAKEHLYYGNYDEVVSVCRVALEGIQASKEEVADSIKSFASDRRAMTKKQRSIYALASLEHYTHPAHHIEGMESYNRNDAIFVLGATIAFVLTKRDLDD